MEQSILEGKVKDAAGLRAELKRGMIAMLTPAGAAQGLQLGDAKPGVILVVGVNGGGKTTTIGKLAHMFQREGAKVCHIPQLLCRSTTMESHDSVP